MSHSEKRSPKGEGVTYPFFSKNTVPKPCPKKKTCGRMSGTVIGKELVTYSKDINLTLSLYS